MNIKFVMNSEQQSPADLAAKRRQNRAHGVSRG